MNYEQIRKDIQEKESLNANRIKKSSEYFDLIKDDILTNLIKKQIECDFKYQTTVYGYEIISLIIEKNNLSVDRYIIETSNFSDVSNEFVRIRLGAITFTNHNSKRYDTAQDFCNSFDYAKLCVMLRNYIISKGFKGRVAVHRFTGEKLRLLEFSITKDELTRLCCKETEKPSVKTWWKFW